MNESISKITEATRLAIYAIEQLQHRVDEQDAELRRMKASLEHERGFIRSILSKAFCW